MKNSYNFDIIQPSLIGYIIGILWLYLYLAFSEICGLGEIMKKNSKDLMQNRLETLDSILNRMQVWVKNMGLKTSKQREEVVSVLYKSGTHLSPEEITNAIKTTEGAASISSVYRILSALEKDGFITSIDVDKGGKRYEIAAKEHHDHIICLKCGDIIEFVDIDIERLQVDVANSFGARLLSHDMKLFVICSACQTSNPDI